MRAINPATDEVIQDYPEHGPEDVARLIARAGKAFLAWRETPFSKRAMLMKSAVRVLRESRGAWSHLMTMEMGKTLASAEAEADKCAWVCEYYADNAERLLAAEKTATDGSESFVRFDPLGTVLAVMPWNFPFWQVFRFAAPNLMAGNVGLLKHASNVPGCALAIEKIFMRAGFPEGVFTALMIPGSGVEAVIRHDEVKAVTLTGSEPAGKSVAAIAGSALKKTVLELGGSDPFIVLHDADVEEAAAQAAIARCINAGQSCIAAKRFIIEETVAERFEKAFVAAMGRLKAGDPMDRKSDLGPLARKDLLDELDGQVKRSVAAGARLALGGKRLGDKGCYYSPTVLCDVVPGNPAFEEEIFGPVGAVIRAKDASHAVELANRSRFGLGASIWTGNAEMGKVLAGRIESGAVFVNGIVKSDPRLPFGGVKASGYGRELGLYGMREFVNIKSVWVK